jgi:hypothetical protein
VRLTMGAKIYPQMVADESDFVRGKRRAEISPPLRGKDGIREESMKSRGEGLQQLRLLVGEYGAKVEDQAVVFDAGDDGNTRWGTAEPLLELSRGVAGAGDADDFGGQSLRRC